MDAAGKQQYLLRSMIEEAISSSIIEGASSTREVARRMLREGRPPRDRSERMIVNNYVTMQRISEVRQQPMSAALLLELHRLVTTGTMKDASAEGRLRIGSDPPVEVADSEGFVAHRPPPSDELPSRLEAMLAFANGASTEPFVHPAVRSIILHFWLAYDHPFLDGNGRTARALFYWSMLHHGYWLLQYVSISEFIARAPMQYARAFLHTETDDFDLTYFVVHQLDALEQAIDALHSYLDRSLERTHAADMLLDELDGLNHRQRSLLAAAIRRPSASFTTGGHGRTHAVTYPTAHADMKGLHMLGLVTRRRVGKQFRYRGVSDMAGRLRALHAEQEAAQSE
ncbi:MAG: Fic family protein [Deltaproteobacteria bacterium]|nr:Fic family protein [Deltaproteobacteria bacterium]